MYLIEEGCVYIVMLIERINAPSTKLDARTRGRHVLDVAAVPAEPASRKLEKKKKRKRDINRDNNSRACVHICVSFSFFFLLLRKTAKRLESKYEI